MPQGALDHVMMRTRVISQRLGETTIVPATTLWQDLPLFRVRYSGGGVNAWHHGFDPATDPRALGRLAY
eukprot:6210906-Lingulodinium_polyedra.AAC.1